ncbi:MAG: hypothetical protein WD646_14310 [Actinomycetota bacterium]
MKPQSFMKNVAGAAGGLDWAKLSNYLAFAVIGLGFLAMYLGWNGAANKNCVDCQIPYLISGGMTGLGLIGTGVGVLVVQNARRNRVEIGEQIRALSDALERSGGGTRRASSPARTVRAGQVVAGASSYHKPNCRLVEGRDDAEIVSVREARDRGLDPCRICKP